LPRENATSGVFDFAGRHADGELSRSNTVPDFRITFKKSDGTKGVRVLSAPDGQSAGTRVLREGHKVLRIEPIAVRAVARMPSARL